VKRSTAGLEIALFFLVFFLPGYIAQAWGFSPGSASSTLLLQSIIQGLPQFLLMAYVVGVRGPASSPQWGFVRFERRDALRVAALVGACFVLILSLGLLTQVLPARWSKALSGGYRWGLESWSQVPLALLFGLTAGYREEFFFRAYLLGRLSEMEVPLPLAAIGSVALFSLGHVYEGPIGVAVTALLGIVLCASYIQRGSLHVVALSHGLYNAIAISLSLFLPRALPGGFLVRIFSP
jgi:membrane protease YdiL (CAAX protease family)